MPIRHNVLYRPQPRGVTPRRLSAATRALRKERERMPLFANQVAAEQLSPEERIQHFDRQLLNQNQGHRDLAAKHWRWGRTQLSFLSVEIRVAILAAWNVSSIPSEAHYFADFIRRQLRDRDIPINDDA